MKLTDRERAVAERYAEGRTFRQVADDLGIAPATVRNHLAAVYRKLDVGNKAALIRALSQRQCDLGILPPARAEARGAPVLRLLERSRELAAAGASIAVMPFETLGPPEEQHFGRGLSADIQHVLTGCPDLFVSGRSSCLALQQGGSDISAAASRLGVRYILRGTLRIGGARVKVGAELVEGPSGALLWSESYDRALGGILDLQQEIAAAIATLLSLRINERQLRLRRDVGEAALTAYDCRLRGGHLLELGGMPNLERAAAYFERALEAEPGDAAALAGLSMCYGYQCDLLLAEDYPGALARHAALAEQAVAADESDSRGHYAMTCAAMMQGDFEKADRHAARASALSPGEYHISCNRGYSLMALGAFDESVACFEESVRRNPLAPSSCLLAVALIDYLQADYGNAAASLAKVTSYPVQRASTLAAACAEAGYRDTAQSAVSQFQKVTKTLPLKPADQDGREWRCFWQRAYPYLRGEAFERMLRGLSKAALPV